MHLGLKLKFLGECFQFRFERTGTKAEELPLELGMLLFEEG